MAIGGFGKLSRWARSVISGAIVLLVTSAFLPFRDLLNPTEVSLTLLLVVLFASTLFGSTAGLVASGFGIVCFNFFFLPPYGTLTISDPENWVAFGAFVITALIAGQISGYARRRAEESESRQREIERLYNELRSAFEQASEAEALRRSEKLKSALLDAVTHDLRTPLTSIKASVTTLLEDARERVLDKDSRQEFLDIINEETDRLDEFVEGMVGIAKIEAGAQGLQKRSSPVDEIVANAVQRAEKLIGDRGLETEIPADPPWVFADAASISEAVFTLIDNAAKYSPANARVRVSAGTGNGTVTIAVEDQGRGVPAAMRERIFDKFVRLEEQDIHRTGSGLGLGLAIAKGIVESQGGAITVGDGEIGFVTKFTITLPAAKREQSRNAETDLGHRR